MELIDSYQSQSDNLARRIKSLKARAHGFVMGEILSFLASVECIGLVTITDNPRFRLLELPLAVVFALAYLIIRMHDTKNDERIHRMEDLKQVYDNELSALRGDFSCFDNGQRYVDPQHAYTYDLDIFGKDSLYQRMSRMATTGGCDALAERLCSLDGRAVPNRRQIWGEDNGAAYRARIESLAQDERFRVEFISCGVREKIDTDAIRQALHAAGEVRVNRLLGSRLLLSLAIADLAAFLACAVLAVVGRVSGLLPIWWGILQFFGVYLLCMGTLKNVSEAINKLHGQVRKLSYVVRLMDNGHADVFCRLTALLDGLDRRGNIMGLILVNTFALYDFFLVRKFIKWNANDRQEIGEWLDRVIAMDQDVTVATFLANHPNTIWSEVTDEAGMHYEAAGLYHPFLNDKAVRNDFRIDDRSFYIITGANMAGKSTFLRSIGVNYVLALLGMPVFAERMRVSRCRLFSSMRTTDDLTHGISYFNAELRRLKQLVDGLTAPVLSSACESSLIILDEILKGTNSLDKLNGSRLFLQSISKFPVSGVIATHDLELSKMEGEQFHNYCFEIELGEDVIYSYKITPGVAQNQNATFLLKHQVLKEK